MYVSLIQFDKWDFVKFQKHLKYIKIWKINIYQFFKLFMFFKIEKCIRWDKMFENFNFQKIKSGISKNWIVLFWKSKFSLGNLKNDPLQNYCTQMEILFPLSPGVHTQPKSNFNTWRTFSMWHIFISTWFSKETHV